MEFEKLYAVTIRHYDIGAITEYTVIKDTPKMYTVQKTDSHGWKTEYAVKKSSMEVYNYHFCKSYAEALEYKIAMLESRIESNERSIAEMTAKNASYRAIIDKTDAELRQLYKGVK